MGLLVKIECQFSDLEFMVKIICIIEFFFINIFGMEKTVFFSSGILEFERKKA